MKTLFLAIILICSPLLGLSAPNQNPTYDLSQTSDQPLIDIGIPVSVIQNEIIDVVKNSSIIHSIDYFFMDPLTRKLMIEGQINYSLDELFNFFQIENTPRSTKDLVRHTFKLAIGFPTTDQLLQTNYLRLTIDQLQIDGVSYLNLFSVVTSFVQAILGNTDLVSYLSNSQVLLPVQNKNLVQELIQNNGIVFNETSRSVSVKLNLSRFSFFKSFSYINPKDLEQVKLWHFGPDLIGGREDYSTFRIIIGLHKPTKKWRDQYKEGDASDQLYLSSSRKKLYEHFGKSENFLNEMELFLEEQLLANELYPLSLEEGYKKELENFQRLLKSESIERLSTENHHFKADPQKEHESLQRETKEKIVLIVLDIKRRIAIKNKILAEADLLNEKMPFLTQKISQNLINGTMNYLRDIEVDGQLFIKDAVVVLAPHIPGMILKGKINADLNYILGKIDSNLLSTNFKPRLTDFRSGIPFQVVMETRMGNQGELALDVQSISFLSGEQTVRLDRHSRHQQFFLDFIKIYLSQTLSSLSFDIKGLDQNISVESLNLKKVQDLKQFLKKINQYSNVTGVVQTIQQDLASNPLISVGEEYLKKKSEILFSDVVYYDESDNSFKIKIDPRIVIENDTFDNFKVWDLAPVAYNVFNNTFLEISVGEGNRNKTYLNQINSFRNHTGQNVFSGLYHDHDQSNVDLLSTLSLSYLEQSINSIITKILNYSNGDYETKIKEEKEQEHYFVSSINFKLKNEKTFFLNVSGKRIRKSKNSWKWLNRREKWVVKEDNISFSAELNIEQQLLSDIKTKIATDKLPIYYNEQVISLIPKNIKINFGEETLIKRILSRSAGPLIEIFKSFLFKYINFFFQDYYQFDHLSKIGTGVDLKKLQGHEIESIVKVLTTKNEIILMLHPRFMGSAFELNLSGKEPKLENSLRFDPIHQEIHLAFSAATSLAKVDKAELAKIIVDSETVLLPFLDDSAQTLKKSDINKINSALLIDQLVLASDPEKLSHYNRFIKVLKNYDAVANLVFDENSADENSSKNKRLTRVGLEVIYFAAVAQNLFLKLDQLVNRIEKSGMRDDVILYNELLTARDRLLSRIATPLKSKYENEFRRRNLQILGQPMTNWTSPFVPDAAFAEKLYSTFK